MVLESAKTGAVWSSADELRDDLINMLNERYWNDAIDDFCREHDLDAEEVEGIINS